MRALRPVRMLLCAAVVVAAAGHDASAQQTPRVYRVATVGADSTNVWDAFQRRLRQLGYVEGDNLILERRWSHGYVERLPTLTLELLRAHPDVLVTSSMLASNTPIDAAACVPILVIAVSEPHGSCGALPVAHMSETASAREISRVHLRLARAVVPSATRIGVLTNSDRPFLVEYVKGLETGAAAAGLDLHVLDISSEQDIGNLGAAIIRIAPDVLIAAPGFTRPDQRRSVVSFATARGISSIGSYIADGVVVAADYDWVALAHRAADLVDQLLRGARLAELPTSAPVKFEVIVDARVAKALGLTLPSPVLSSADRVLQ